MAGIWTSSTLKQRWEGEFQIVITDSEKEMNGKTNSMNVQNMLLRGGSDSSLKTEVEMLKLLIVGFQLTAEVLNRRKGGQISKAKMRELQKGQKELQK